MLIEKPRPRPPSTPQLTDCERSSLAKFLRSVVMRSMWADIEDHRARLEQAFVEVEQAWPRADYAVIWDAERRLESDSLPADRRIKVLLDNIHLRVEPVSPAPRGAFV